MMKSLEKKPLNIEAAINKLPIGRGMVLSLVLCALVMLIDGYDLSAMPLSIPYLIQDMALDPQNFKYALSAVLVGLGLGAIGLAPLGDRYGRRPAIILGVLMIGLLTIATGTAGSIRAFVIWRFLTGLALGLCLPNVTALVAEISPVRARAFLLTLTSSGITIGAMGAGFLVPTLVSSGGWPLIFWASGGITLLMVLALLWRLPESPKFVLDLPKNSSGDQSKYNRLFARLGFEKGPKNYRSEGDENAKKGSVLVPLQPQYRFGCGVFTALYTVNAFALYLLVSWVPSLLADLEFSNDNAARLSSFMQLGGLICGLLISWFLDRGHDVGALLMAYFLVIFALIGFSFVPPTFFNWSLLLLLAGGGIAGGHMAIMAVGTSFFPTSVLSAAIGIAVAVGRLGAILGPIIGGNLIAAGISPQRFFLCGIVPVMMCMGLVLLIPFVRAKMMRAEM